MKRKIILLLVTLWISIFIISGCSMMPHLNASAQTVIDTKKEDRKSTRLNSSHANESRMPSSA